jgi:tricorn protease-like protein
LVNVAGDKFSLVGDMAGAGNEYVVPADGAHFRRKTYVTDVVIRNRARQG